MGYMNVNPAPESRRTAFAPRRERDMIPAGRDLGRVGMAKTGASTNLAFALAGLGGFNAHGAGFLQAARDYDLKPDLITATSGQIVVLTAYLNEEQDLRKGLIDPAIENNPLAQLRIALLGYPGVFEPATGEAIRRILTPPYIGNTLDFFAARFLPAQLYKPSRSADVIGHIRETLNGSEVGVVFNAYDPISGEGVLYGNDAARERMQSTTNIGFVADQLSADTRISPPADKEQPIRRITSESIESALWLTLYGFVGMPHSQMDGAYHRSCIVSELHNFSQVIVCRPLANGWRKKDLPQSYFDVQDWNTEMWFSASYKAEIDAMKRINRLIEKKALDHPDYRFVDLLEVEPETPAGYFNYFIERDSVFDQAREKASALFRWIEGGKAGPKPR